MTWEGEDKCGKFNSSVVFASGDFQQTRALLFLLFLFTFTLLPQGQGALPLLVTFFFPSFSSTPVAGFRSTVCFCSERSLLTPTLLYLRSLFTSTLRPLPSELRWKRSRTGPGQMSYPSLHADAEKRTRVSPLCVCSSRKESESKPPSQKKKTADQLKKDRSALWKTTFLLNWRRSKLPRLNISE